MAPEKMFPHTREDVQKAYATEPMQSTKLDSNTYVVLGTTTACEIRRVGDNRAPIWLLYSDGSLVESFVTKREALVHCQEHPEL